MTERYFPRRTVSVMAIGALTVGAGIFGAAQTWQGQAGVDSDLPSLAVNGSLAGASLALLILQREAWAAILFTIVSGAYCVVATVDALPGATELTAWVLPAQMLALAGAGLLQVSLVTRFAVYRCTILATAAIALMCALFGVIHLLNAATIASMVPTWIPMRESWPFVTGGIQVVAAVGMLIPRTRRLATLVIAAMFASWIIVLHLPRLASAPTDFGEWAFAAMALALTGALLSVAYRDEGEPLRGPTLVDERAPTARAQSDLEPI